ncbi:ATP phosphoribosyltransferase regulatory subunit [Leptolyngbya sp. FACHB-321]|uniref:ATP phosphoribosyltransferase regulatory subunit n=1 Tax=Leptolyngbya sp. FACHB-321 TaxID=2692807 RepID=UPI001687F78C|nr:ATP phosphoribosyltransferase regulatory subunit [Leptolyngbya sp. FACHB-321]MBD2034797.1 ATP phosphoribosyltransferase regulatory subunit [Leptolyngbya sp. FACHB-321]
MVYQPPAGARDLLPLDVAQKRWIEDRLQQVFQRWGYHRIITSTLERLDTLMAGGAIQRSTVLQLQEADDEQLGLRPELTASIARTAVTRMAGSTHPLRLYYNANVFRRASEGGYSRQQEFYQAGVELVGAGGLLADAEVLLLVLDCLRNLGLQQWSVILGEAGLTRSLLSIFPTALRDKVRQAIARLDRLMLEALPMSPALRERAMLLLDLRGRPSDVLQRLATIDLDASQQEAVNNLKSLVDLLQTSDRPDPAVPPADNLILDLSLIRTLDYYTGVVFEVVSTSTTGQQVLGQGGRYDQLLGLYHPEGQTHPGIGFALQIEHLHQVLLPTGQLPQQTTTSDWLIVPDSPQAYTAALAHAQTLRDSPTAPTVELDLGGRDAAAIHEYARRRRIAQVAWVKPDGKTVIETVSQQLQSD